MIRRINFFGGPGVGKTTLASRAFVMQKQFGFSVAQVPEVVQQLVYVDQPPRGWDHVLIFAQQLNAEFLPLNYGVQQIISDSPLLLQCIYAQHHGCAVTTQMASVCFEFEKHYPSINFLVERSFPFNDEGRFQTSLEEAIKIDQLVEDGITVRYVPFTRIKPDMTDYQLESLLDEIGETQ